MLWSERTITAIVARVDALQRVLEPHREKAYFALRMATGLMFSFHGVQKLFGLWSPDTPEFGSQLWFGGIIEFVGGLLVACGAYTSWAAFLASGTMAVAYVQFHWRFRFHAALFPTMNRGELALVYSFLFLFIACAGPGEYSIEALRAAGMRARRATSAPPLGGTLNPLQDEPQASRSSAH